jgi:hypothetical protein
VPDPIRFHHEVTDAAPLQAMTDRQARLTATDDHDGVVRTGHLHRSAPFGRYSRKPISVMVSSKKSTEAVATRRRS